jgi:hypothetical protein
VAEYVWADSRSVYVQGCAMNQLRWGGLVMAESGMLRSWLQLSLLCLTPFLATCGGDGPTDVPDPPVPGQITVRLTGEGLVGGALFEVEGPVGAVSAVVGVTTVLSSASGVTRRVIAHGNITSGPVVLVAMDDVRRKGEVRVRLLELANGQTFEQIPVAGWSLTIDP